MKLLKDIMKVDVITAQKSSNIREISKIMKEENIGSVAILDGEQLVGIVTERDLAVKVLAGSMDPDTELVESIMQANIVTASPDTTLEEAVGILSDGGFRRLPILRDGKLAGMVTETDLEKAMRQEAIDKSQARIRDHYRFQQQIREQERRIEDLENLIKQLEQRECTK